MPPRITPLTEEDVPAVAELERQAFSDPWPARAFSDELRNPNARLFVLHDADSRISEQPSSSVCGVHGTATVAPSPIIGMCGIWVVLDEAQLITISVRPDRRRRGYGALLLSHAIQTARDLGAETMTLEARASNRAAQSLYARFGFVPVGRRRGYYSSPREDAIVMTVANLQSADVASRLAALRREAEARIDEKRADPAAV